ncbi:MAG: hypothetical protein P9X24_06050 [Candidatus Hatepunaea meridiana]|nr:hypothetical protein [Candidatus Hatepunaea meridiana]
MQIILIISTLLGGAAAIWFFWDRFSGLSVRTLIMRFVNFLKRLITRSDSPRHCELFFHFWDGTTSSFASPPSNQRPGTYDLNLSVKTLTTPNMLRIGFSIELPYDASIDLIHLESESVLPKNTTLREAGIHEHDNLIFAYGPYDLEMICHFIRLRQ